METKIEEWKIEKLYSSLPKILEQPKYQRGAVWTLLKKQMLIDSILRGIDVPKIYLRRMNNSAFQYEVADGQQRIIAIREFINKKFTLSSKVVNGLDLSKIGHFTVSEKDINTVNAKLKQAFLRYKLTVAIVENSTNYEIRTLFGRLQMGDSLNPAEKRNALISKLGLEIDNIVLNHDFFTHCKISEERFKRQDYLTHVIALLYYDNKHDLKAPLFTKLYLDSAVPNSIIADVIKILNWVYEIDRVAKKKITNKWSFVDIFRLLYELKENIKSIDYKEFAKVFYDFEQKRIEYSNRSEELISGKKPSQAEKTLYDYILAFKANGGHPQNLNKRLNTFKFVFEDAIVII
jgi:hypothetical protein